MLNVVMGILVTLVIHEVSHVIAAFRRIRGFFVGTYKGLISVGFIVYPVRYVDFVLPQLLVPLIVYPLFGDILVLISSVVCNVSGGVVDLINMFKVKEINSLPMEEVIRRDLSNIRGYVFIRR